MSAFFTIVTAILVFSFFVFVTFFGRLPALRNTPIASLYRLLWVHTPNLILSVDQRVSGGRITGSLLRLGNYLLYDRHPTIVILFLAIMLVGEYLFLPAVWPHISLFTKLTAAIAATAPLAFLYLSCAADPGYVTPATHQYHMSLYPYDHAIFSPGSECRTCRQLKPARSKHCSICKRCVAKSDHHCVFINSCVGYGNHHWFLLLLFSTAIMTTYGGFLGLSVLGRALVRRHPTWTPLPNKAYSYTRWFAIWGHGLRADVKLGSTTLLALLTSPLVWGLALYTLYQVYTGMTTNESLKWTDLKEDMQDGYAFRRPLSASRPRDLRKEPDCDRWPVRPESVIVATLDGQPPNGAGFAGEGEWERVRALRDVENLYDLGFWDNLCDVFVPHYDFGNGSDEPFVERRRKKN